MALRKRKRLLTGLFLFVAVIGAFLARPSWHILTTILNDENHIEERAPGFTNDASRLNKTPIAEFWQIPVESDQPVKQLTELLERARSEGKRVSIAGARHSMGGHTIYPGGIVIDTLPWNQMKLNEEKTLLTVQSGAVWADILDYLEPLGCSVAVMQSNNSFTVGGSISVNCHGWQFGRPPIASTVESFRMMTADGTLLRCSRTENEELFSLALGGYGLFGIILDVELRIVPNQRYRLQQRMVPVAEAIETFEKKVRTLPDVEMVYARMNVVPDSFLMDVIINAHIQEEGEIPKLTEPGMQRLKRAVFRGSARNDYGKKLRWDAETKIQPLLAGEVFSRNQLLNDGVNLYQNRSAENTDILHEYFIPEKHLVGFVQSMREIIPKHNGNLLNVTVRSVRTDHDTFLRYAKQPLIAFVLLFVQEKNTAAEKRMQTMARELIDAALQRDGCYYLPYRLHATLEQFQAAYPMAPEFFERKRFYDPDELFQNEFYLKYGKSPAQIRD